LFADYWEVSHTSKVERMWERAGDFGISIIVTPSATAIFCEPLGVPSSKKKASEHGERVAHACIFAFCKAAFFDDIHDLRSTELQFWGGYPIPHEYAQIDLGC